MIPSNEQIDTSHQPLPSLTGSEGRSGLTECQSALSDQSSARPKETLDTSRTSLPRTDGVEGWSLFRTFFHIGLFTIGGGYAMIPLIEAKVVDEKQWISREDLLDLMAVAQSCPGIFAVNIAIFIGYKIRGTWGALASTLGCILPSFLIILAIALFFRQFQDNPWVARAFRGIRPCVVALIAAPTFKMAKTAKIGWTNVWIPVLGAFLIWMFGVSPIWIIVAAGLGGYLYGLVVESPQSAPEKENPSDNS